MSQPTTRPRATLTTTHESIPGAKTVYRYEVTDAITANDATNAIPGDFMVYWGPRYDADTETWTVEIVRGF